MGKKSTLPKMILNSRPMDWRWVDYDYCKYVTGMAGIKTFRQFRSWVRDYKPGGIPSRPELIYSEWNGWAHFLDTDNVYDADNPKSVREKDLMPFWEACNLIQAMQLRTKKEYFKAFDDGQIPKGITKRPDRRYPSFHSSGGWKNWLGKNIKHRLEASKNIKPLLILYQSSERSENILSIIIHKQGVTSMMKMIRDRKLNVVKIFHWYPEFAEHIFGLFNQYGMQQDDNSWLFSNRFTILYELESVLEIFTTKS